MTTVYRRPTGAMVFAFGLALGMTPLLVVGGVLSAINLGRVAHAYAKGVPGDER